MKIDVWSYCFERNWEFNRLIDIVIWNGKIMEL